ncbi:DinB family protein [Amycolatopsis suaedae]|uniref:DinB family protein n=1 Tax=Amycolatopsis suaedae TaxID=2510978 RepID=A0A4Q7J8P1_9PSEU|nr:DinB family protein [Amycolatopsis suaedae]RZQ63222.1 DinB family protein [Amycolatopsis suaedae]
MTVAPERPEPAPTGSEFEQLAGFLDFLRATVEWKCAGLTDEQARRSLVPSELTTVAGLLGHLVWVESYWFEVRIAGRPDPLAEELAADRDADFRDGMRRPLDELLAAYRTQCARSREVVAGLDLDHTVPWRDTRVTLRWVLIHMIEETARHAGHLDLLRELTDGLTGE